MRRPRRSPPQALNLRHAAALALVPLLLGIFQLFAQLGKSPSVGDLDLLVVHLGRITQTADKDTHGFEPLIAAWQAVSRRSKSIRRRPT
jgi:hypothetical protein